nr:MAG TPA: hypothetical protein [Bacteriophage sp.]
MITLSIVLNIVGTQKKHLVRKDRINLIKLLYPIS